MDRKFKSVKFISDPYGEFATKLGLPTNSASITDPETGKTTVVNYIERVTLIGKKGKIGKIISEIEKPAENIKSIITALQPEEKKQSRSHDRPGTPNPWDLSLVPPPKKNSVAGNEDTRSDEEIRANKSPFTLSQ